MKCCEQFEQAWQRKADIIFMPFEQAWNVVDCEMSDILRDIKYCPFCGEKLIAVSSVKWRRLNNKGRK